MTIYHATGQEVEILGADLSGDSDWTVWWAYRKQEFESGLEERHRGVNRGPLTELRADDGMQEVFAEIASLPENRVRGQQKAEQESPT